MSGIMPLFASAPRIKLRINGGTVAYAIGFNINISVDVQPIFAIGSYGPVALEPTYHNAVTGTIQIIRLVRPSTLQTLLGDTSLKDADITKGGTKKFNAVFNNSVGQGLTTDSATALDPSLIGKKGIFAHLDPGMILASQTFDMEVYMKLPMDSVGDAESSDLLDDENKKKLIEGFKEVSEVLWMKVVDCRLSARNTNITLGQIVNEPVNFQGILATPMNNGNEQIAIQDDKITDKIS